MHLAEWMQEEKLSLAQAARGIGAANASVVQRYRDGQRIPDRERMRRLVIASDGRVTPNDIYGLTELIEQCLERRARRLAKKAPAEPHPQLPFMPGEAA